jgi:hypothetical protein
MKGAPDGIVLLARRRGSDARDARDAAHEACHALEANASLWARESIHQALCRMYTVPADLVMAEVRARAVEAEICRRLGISYDPRRWLQAAEEETMLSQIGAMPLSEWVKAVALMSTRSEIHRMVNRILFLADKEGP